MILGVKLIEFSQDKIILNTGVTNTTVEYQNLASRKHQPQIILIEFK